MLSSSHYLKTSSYRSPAPQYYQPNLSIWLSVDPMSDKYPSLSPYVYCGNNPVKLVDPNGEEVYDGGKPDKRKERFEKFFYNKVSLPLTKMAENGASVSGLESEAASLANQYQKKLLQMYKCKGEYKSDESTTVGYRQVIDIKLFSETEEKIEVNGRPDDQSMIVCGEIPLGANVYSAQIDFAPYGVENYATFTAANKVETGWINSPNGNSFSYDLDVNGAEVITYCIQNKLADKRQDNWNFTVTLRSRRLNIRTESRITDHFH